MSAGAAWLPKHWSGATMVWGHNSNFQHSWRLSRAQICVRACPGAGQSSADTHIGEGFHPQWGHRRHKGMGGKTTSPKGATQHCRYLQCRSSPRQCRPCSLHQRHSASAWGCSAHSCTGTGRTRSVVCSLSAGEG